MLLQALHPQVLSMHYRRAMLIYISWLPYFSKNFHRLKKKTLFLEMQVMGKIFNQVATNLFFLSIFQRYYLFFFSFFYFFCIFVSLVFFLFVFFVFVLLMLLFACLFDFYLLKLKIYIVIHIRLCRQVSDKKNSPGLFLETKLLFFRLQFYIT